LVALKGYLVSVVLSMAVLQFWGFPACKTGDFHFAILGIFSLQETPFQIEHPDRFKLNTIAASTGQAQSARREPSSGP
jgi:hypothetical protein